MIKKQPLYQIPKSKLGFVPNFWDIASLLIIFSVLATLAWSASQMTLPFHVGVPIPVTLSPSELPGYAANTVLRMLIALACSVIFTLIVAPIAGKNEQARKLIIPVIDILQSIPILGMLSITVMGFIALFPNSLLGPECAAIFAIFTSQVWNMTLGVYQSFRTIPKEMHDTAAIFHLSGWQKYWRIEIPHAIPGLIWNSMVSMSGGWFFLVAAEAISVANQKILLPGIGSYISLAIQYADLQAIFYAILTMLIVILLYDQLLFRPLLAWSEKFKNEAREEDVITRSWFYNILAKTGWLRYMNKSFERVQDFILNPPHLSLKNNALQKALHLPTFNFSPRAAEISVFCWNAFLILSTLIASFILLRFILQTVSWAEIRTAFYLGLITGFKVAVLTVLASCLWIPVGVWIGLNPRYIPYCQPLIQFVAAFPINLIYPIAVTLILYFKLNVEIWTAPLMILGTQWYILFNVIAGAASIPQELRLAAENFGVKGWLLWKKLLLPAIFPFYITGAMAAAAGCWNASIVAEVLTWGNHTLKATGLGNYITTYTNAGDFQHIALGIAVMSCYVLLINRFVWHQLYQKAATQFVLE